MPVELILTAALDPIDQMTAATDDQRLASSSATLRKLSAISGFLSLFSLRFTETLEYPSFSLHFTRGYIKLTTSNVAFGSLLNVLSKVCNKNGSVRLNLLDVRNSLIIIRAR